MSSGIGGGISGGAGRGGRGGGGNHRKNPKKFGKNLNKLTKAPAAPPVPVTSSSGGGGSGSSFRGSSSSRNGLLLLSTKSKSSGSKSAGSGLLAPLGAPKTAHDALLFSAGAGGQGGGEAGKKSTPAPAWGMGEKKPAAPSPEKVAEKSAEGNERAELVLSRRNSLQQHRPSTNRSTVSEVAEKLERVDLEAADIPTKISPDYGKVEKPIDRSSTNATQPKEMEKPAIVANPPKEKPIVEVTPHKEEPVSVAKQVPPKEEKVKDDQVEYMSKLAKERAEKLRLEEETRMAAQKERAAIRLRELEDKRLEERKRQLEEKKKQQQIKSEARKELSKPQVILEPLGKSKKDASNSSSPKPTSKTQHAEKYGGRKLYDPDRPYSSLVGGKTTRTIVDNAKKLEERPRGNAKKSSSPAGGPGVVHYSKQPIVQSSSDNKKDDPPPPVHMVQLSKLGELDRGGRGGGQSGPRMLFDPSSGSMVAVPSRGEESKSSMKKAKQSKGPQKSPAKRSDEVGKIISRRPSDGVVANDSGSDVKILRGKHGKASRKDEPMLFQPKNKKVLDNKARPFVQHQTPRKRIPRTCGVLYKMEKGGNYLNVDGCEPDNGYGAYRLPGGKVKNPGAYAKLLKQQEEENTPSQPINSDAPPAAAEGFSFRNDPGFLQHQTDDFEAQQQKILEDAWASLVENEEPIEEEATEVKEEEEELPVSKSGDDEYAAAMAISSSAFGLNFDPVDNIDSVLLPPAIKASAEEPIDLAKFALEAASSVSAAPPANPFTPLGVSGASLWGTGAHSATSTSSYGDLGALTGWVATPFAETDTVGAPGSAGLNGKSSKASKLHLWGGSTALDTLDDSGLGSFGNSDVSGAD